MATVFEVEAGNAAADAGAAAGDDIPEPEEEEAKEALETEYGGLDVLRRLSIVDDAATMLQSTAQSPSARLSINPRASRTVSGAFKKFGVNASTKMYTSHALIAACASYTVAASSEYWIVYWFKDKGVNLPIFFALLQNALWPYVLWSYYRERQKLPEPRVLTPKQYQSYFILGMLSSFISLARMYGMSFLPPVIYIIVASTEIVWETIMTRCVLMKSVSLLQYFAVLVVIISVPLSIYNPTPGADSFEDSNKSKLKGILLGLSSRFASSLNTILAERFLGLEKKSKIGVSECTLANCIIPFFMIPFLLMFLPEYKSWEVQLGPSRSGSTKAILVALSFSLAVSKQIDRLSKFSIVQGSSTIFFGGVDACMKMVAGVGAFVFFGEEVAWPQILSFLLVGLSVLLLFYDKKLKMKAVDTYLTAAAATARKSIAPSEVGSSASSPMHH